MKNIHNKYKGVHIEYHILQSFPVTCLNRDDVGSPKTANIGGVTRARVSSQSWKRPVRMCLADFDIKLAIRTKLIAELIAEQCIKLGATEEQSTVCSKTIADFLEKDTLHFITETEVLALANYAKEKEFKEGDLKENEVQKKHKESYDPNIDGLDIALFGRMVAKAPSLDIEAASSFSHAISTHAISNEIDFFTAVDDKQTDDNQGASHLGIIEYNSATYYRYISLSLGQLYATLGGDENFNKAIDAFTKALYVAVPTARQTTLSGASPWDYARVLVRKGQRLQVSFDKPVQAKQSGYAESSIKALNSALDAQEKVSGSLYGKINSFILDIQATDPNAQKNIDTLIASIQDTINTIS